MDIKKKTITKPKLKKFTVWVGQVNQSRFEVNAVDEEDAIEKGYKVWRKEWAHYSDVTVKEGGY